MTEPTKRDKIAETAERIRAEALERDSRGDCCIDLTTVENILSESFPASAQSAEPQEAEAGTLADYSAFEAWLDGEYDDAAFLYGVRFDKGNRKGPIAGYKNLATGFYAGARIASKPSRDKAPCAKCTRCAPCGPPAWESYTEIPRPSREEDMRKLLAEIDSWITEYNEHWRSYSVSERLKLLNRLAAIQDMARAALAQGGARDDNATRGSK